MKAIVSFLKSEDLHNLKIADRLVALIWYYQTHDDAPVEFTQMVEDYTSADYGILNNKSNMCEKLRKDKRTVSLDKGKCFTIHVTAMKLLDDQFLHLIKIKPIKTSNTLFSLDDFEKTRGYITNVVRQINVSYDEHLYDCCAVMIRRLLETLIIEVYEQFQRADELKGRDDNFMMFSGLLSHLENDSQINLGRQTLTGMKQFKSIADSSAHNRRFNATKKIIDDKIHGVQVAVVELKQMAFDN